MNAQITPSSDLRPDGRLVVFFHYVIACTPVVFIGGIIGWVVHLIRTSLKLHDVQSAAIGISLVAIPVFITLMSVLLYVLWGLIRAGRQP